LKKRGTIQIRLEKLNSAGFQLSSPNKGIPRKKKKKLGQRGGGEVEGLIIPKLATIQKKKASTDNNLPAERGVLKGKIAEKREGELTNGARLLLREVRKVRFLIRAKRKQLKVLKRESKELPL